MKNKERVVRGTVNKTHKEIFAIMGEVARMEPLLVDRSLAKKIAQGAKRAKITAGQYASALLDAQLHSKTHR